MNSPESRLFLPSEIAAAAWRESLSTWSAQGGRSADIAAALAARRSACAPTLAAAMAAAKVTSMRNNVRLILPNLMLAQHAVVSELREAAASASARALQLGGV